MEHQMKTKSPKIIFFAAVLLSVFSLASCATTGILIKVLENTDVETISAVHGAVNSINKATENFTPENEYYIGRSVAAAVISKYPLEKESDPVNEYLNNICTAITVNSPLPYLYKGYYVAVLDSNEINAISTPGGHILISRGLIESCNSEDELASVIAHEIAHIQLKHSIKVIESSRIAAASLDTAKAVALVVYDNTAKSTKNFDKDEFKEKVTVLWDVQSELVNTLVENGYSQQQEFDADQYAVELMLSAGYNPEAMSSMLTNIAKNSTFGGWNKTHPSAATRNLNVKKQLKILKYKGKYSAERTERFNAIKSEL